MAAAPINGMQTVRLVMPVFIAAVAGACEQGGGARHDRGITTVQLSQTFVRGNLQGTARMGQADAVLLEIVVPQGTLYGGFAPSSDADLAALRAQLAGPAATFMAATPIGWTALTERAERVVGLDASQAAMVLAAGTAAHDICGDRVITAPATASIGTSPAVAGTLQLALFAGDASGHSAQLLAPPADGELPSNLRSCMRNWASCRCGHASE